MSKIPKTLLSEVNKWRNLERVRPTDIIIPGPGQESVWDYPRPPRVERVKSRIHVEFGGLVIADSNKAYRVLETASPPVYYIPQGDIQMKYLEPGNKLTLCEWKGNARYWTVRVGKKCSENAGWSYPEPWVGFELITDYIAFNAGKMDACYVGNEKVLPQPGNYYGGWITSEIVGPLKGEPGTEGW
jgi:uncharacterized protein (DUF427 family)